MIWPYLRTGCPGSMSTRATLCPSAIGSRTSTVRPPTVRTNPLGIGRAATATLSSPRKRTARCSSAAVAMTPDLVDVETWFSAAYPVLNPTPV